MLSHTEEKKVEGLEGSRVLTEAGRPYDCIHAELVQFPELLSLSTHNYSKLCYFLEVLFSPTNAFIRSCSTCS